MQQTNNLGIWLDHSIAKIIYSDPDANYMSIKSDFTKETKEETLIRSENIMHNKEQQMHTQYYNTIGAEIIKYNKVLLFGPTNAKTELFNHLNKDAHFEDVQIDIKVADKMTNNERVAFVRNYFETN